MCSLKCLCKLGEIVKFKLRIFYLNVCINRVAFAYTLSSFRSSCDSSQVRLTTPPFRSRYSTLTVSLAISVYILTIIGSQQDPVHIFVFVLINIK